MKSHDRGTSVGSKVSRQRAAFALLLSIILVMALGAGCGDSTPKTTIPDNDWDEMKWDEGKWR